ncbi:RNA polymerase sigma-70 factor (ECF subfamily) [Mucilaginibacter gracilis]|uniref:RNA polymerase sigma-70 factor (ECF subfamily) n=1 Tax=Mucilaginibacter gracilis TaxID=423350 RepID=A0A495IWV7_9SPHI|nr:RNA polymerase sigma-70 factor [Mucilaginibacter gracilis]RKR80518.1 RNA polymerase sigma-70 factor (ECF subfamily) [Mucilaginibacter gracilis]
MALKDLTDHSLLKKCRQDDQSAYEILFERYFRRLFNFTLHYIKDPVIAEELVMDLMLMLWKKRHQIELRGDLLPYLFGAMRNTVISHVRKRAIVTTSLEVIHNEFTGLARSADYDLYSREAEGIYQQKLNKLSPQRRLVFEMSRFENKSYAEIAGQLNLSLNTVRNHMTASLQYFREHLGKYIDATLTVMLLFLMKR